MAACDMMMALVVFACMISPPKKKLRSATGAMHMFPAIYGNKIVWADGPMVELDIYMYDLSTKKQTQITTNGFGKELILLSMVTE